MPRVVPIVLALLIAPTVPAVTTPWVPAAWTPLSDLAAASRATLADAQAVRSASDAIALAAARYGAIDELPLPAPLVPSVGLAAILDRSGATAPPSDLEAFDALPPRARDALGRLLAAYLAADDAAHAALATAAPLGVDAETGAVTDETAITGSDPRGLISAASLLARAGEVFAEALGPLPAGAPPPLLVCGAVGLDFQGVDSSWPCATKLLVDIGGDDRYRSYVGASPPKVACAGSDLRCRRILVENTSTVAGFGLDLAGNDVYESPRMSGFGTAGWGHGVGFQGVGVLVDVGGHDRYVGGVDAQGFGADGVGVLADLAGDDEYVMAAGGQGFAVARGIGVLYDPAGSDAYTLAAGGQGAASAGVGLLLDGGGDDRYLGVSLSAQGHGSANILYPPYQGVGVLADLGGSDEYVGWVHAQGVGYFGGFGALLDAGAGDDRYLSGYITQGAGRLAGQGVLLDDGGNDFYHAGATAVHIGHTGLAAQGYGLSGGAGLLLDEAGDDEYRSLRNVEPPWSEVANGVGLGLRADLAGDDRYDDGSSGGFDCDPYRTSIDADQLAVPEPSLCVGADASPHGSAEGEHVALSPNGDARGTVAVSGSGRADGIVAASLLGPADGWVAASALGPASGLVAAVSVAGGALGYIVGVSGTGEAWGLYAASGTGDAYSHGCLTERICGVSVSVAGHADAYGGTAVEGCDATSAICRILALLP